MSNSYLKLSVLVLLGTLSVGFASVAKAGMIVNWVYAFKKLDCHKTCQTTGLSHPIFSATKYDKLTKKHTPISICATQKDKRSHQWLTGYNIGTGEQEIESSCIIGIDGKEYHGTEYFCLCTDQMLQPLR